jgi:hypothetical protein
VADNQRDHGKEPLTEREREVLQMLAKEIVREAGLDRDPEKEAAEQSRREFIEGGREHWKAQVDFFKHMAVISAASVVGVGAASEILPADKGWPGPEVLALSPFLFLISAFGSLMSLYVASRRLTQFS